MVVASGIAVNLTVSKGPRPVVMRTVPNVVGMTIANARSAVTSAGFTATFSINVNSSTVPAGNVISASPAAGPSVAQRTNVMFYVSSGNRQRYQGESRRRTKLAPRPLLIF